MNPARYAIEHRAVSFMVTLLVVVGGLLAYQKLGRLEDPQFTIKTAVIFTRYPGATPLEVEQEVTEKIETAVQQVKQLDEVRSLSRAGLSIVYADMQDQYDKDSLPQVWDELRRKIRAVEDDLPPGAMMPNVNDDFGDVYGIFFALQGDGYSYRELEEFADDLRRELLLCKDVGKIDFWGVQPEVVYVEIDRHRLAQLGLPVEAIFKTISEKNTVAPSGEVQLRSEQVRFRVTGTFEKVKDLEELLVQGGADGEMLRLKDVVEVKRGYLEPPVNLLRRDGKPAVGLGISTVLGGNVVVMGDAVKQRLKELEPRIPVGLSIEPIAFQADTVREAVQGFVLNLFEAVAIVIGLLVLFMGLREGFIIGAILLITILGTFIGMQMMEVNLQRISLGALIIALGMLVDNAIVVAEGIVIKSQQGMRRADAAEKTVTETQWPLLGATIIAILAFAAISISKDVTGEFLGSLFKVIAVSLGLSWIFAVTLTPWLCVKLLPPSGHEAEDAYNNRFFHGYRGFLSFCIRRRYLTLLVVLAVLVTAFWGFGFVQKSFFPNSSRPQFTIDFWFPEGTHIDATSEALRRASEKIAQEEPVTHINTFCGQGALRFILTYDPEMPQSNYGQLLVEVDDFNGMTALMDKIRPWLDRQFPSAVTKVEAFRLGPGGAAVEARLIGPEANTLRQLADRAMAIMRDEPNAAVIRHDWGERVKVARVDVAEVRAREIGVTRPDISQTLEMNFSGAAAGLFRQGDDLLPILLRPPLEQRQGIDNAVNLQVRGAGHQTLAIGQVIDGIRTDWEDPVIHRLNRSRTLTVSCKQREGTADTLFRKLRGPIEAIPLPEGYHLEWGGEYENSTEANQKLMAKVPLAFTLMFLICVMLFNTLRHPIIVFLGLPLAVIGVTAGLLLSGQPFGFMATLGFLSLSGMLMKNEIVLLEQINIERAAGREPGEAVVEAAVSRVRPVCMAAFTTVLGMIPLLWDAFFAAMAVTIMAGLTFATVLTLVVIPVLYATFFRIRLEKE